LDFTNVDFFTYILLIGSGWFMLGIPVYLLTLNRYADLSRKVTIVFGGASVGIGAGLSIFGASSDLIGALITCVPVTIAAMLGLVISLRPKKE
jgi:hypothetical protein